MTPSRSRVAAATAAALAALSLAACDPTGDPTSTGESSTPPSGPEQQLTVLSQGPVLSWDPQRMMSRQISGFASRTYLRTLTTYAPETDLAGQKELVGDLATSTGRASKDQKTWSFTLRKGATWQDGSPVTCADLRYGVARSLEDSTGSPGYALTYLDIPKKPDGSSRYPGPYGKAGATKSAKALLAKAVSCKGSTITYRLGEPVADFDAVVSTPEFAPYKKSRDKRNDSTYDAYSTGPYKLEKSWTPGSGGTWVRNQEWSAKSDPTRSPTLRTIVHREDVTATDAVTEIADGDDGSRSVLLDPLPETLQEPVAEAGDHLQTVSTDGQIVDYLAPNLESKVLSRASVRQALAMSTDREAYLEAIGGATAGTPVWSLLGTAIPSAHEPVVDHGPNGDPEAAKALLTKAKVSSPKVRVAYRTDDTSEAAMTALEQGWERAGFAVTLVPLEGEYFQKISSAQAVKKYDVMWANWGADYPSASTILPLLFDDRINVTKTSSGRDYGRVADKKVNSLMDKAMRTGDDTARHGVWEDADVSLLKSGSYIPLVQRRSTFVGGRDVTGLTGNAVYGGALEIGTIGVNR